MEEKPEYKIIEQTLKVLINAGYGVISSEMFDYYCPPFGESVTAWGRSSITSLFEKVEADGVKLVYSDTDSVFIIADKEYIKTLMKWGGDVLGLELGIDYVAEVFVLYRSKNYVMRIDGKFNVKGMTGKKKNTPPIIKECFENCLEAVKLLNESNYDLIKSKLIEVVFSYRDYIKLSKAHDMEVERFKLSTSMNQPMGSYKVESSHVRSAVMLAKELERKMKRSANYDKLVPAGSTIEHVHVDRASFKQFYKGDKDPNTKTIPLILATSEMLNRGKYIEALMSVLSQLLVPFGITSHDFNNQQDINEWL